MVVDRKRGMTYRPYRVGFPFRLDSCCAHTHTHTLTTLCNAPGSKARAVLPFSKRLCFPIGKQSRFGVFSFPQPTSFIMLKPLFCPPVPRFYRADHHHIDGTTFPYDVVGNSPNLDGKWDFFVDDPADLLDPNNNTVIVRNGNEIGDSVGGGYAYSDSGTATATNNTITISGSPGLTAANLFGGGGLGGRSGGSDFRTGNTFNLHSPKEALNQPIIQRFLSVNVSIWRIFL